MNIKILCFIVLILHLLNFDLNAIVFERRNNLNDDIFEYYFLVAPIERPGFGSLITVGSIVNNIPVPWVEDGKFNLIGGIGKGKGENEFAGEDIDAYGITIIDFPVFSNNFTFSPARLSATKFSYAFYERGINSDPKRKFMIMADRVSQNIGEISYYFLDRQIEVFYTFFNAEIDFYGYKDYDGNIVSLKDVEGFGSGTSKWTERWGILVDDTDFRRDPRIGYFIKLDRWEWPNRTPQESSWFQYDLETTGYLPIIDMKLIMVLTQYMSTSKVIKPGNVNKFTCSEQQLLIYPKCQIIVDEAYRRDLENSKKGRATALGGFERLRGYPEGRFFDEHTNFRGIELRYYFDSVDLDFDLFFAKGFLAEFQLAGFYEQGTVSPDLDGNFWSNFKDSYGFGLRMITGSAVARLDFGFSSEGGATTAYWDYPF
tara:strand:- start:1167 stop:2450 length:1284 start_codon:yes stop_codon:yes gene_type:complete